MLILIILYQLGDERDYVRCYINIQCLVYLWKDWLCCIMNIMIIIKKYIHCNMCTTYTVYNTEKETEGFLYIYNLDLSHSKMLIWIEYQWSTKSVIKSMLFLSFYSLFENYMEHWKDKAEACVSSGKLSCFIFFQNKFSCHFDGDIDRYNAISCTPLKYNIVLVGATGQLWTKPAWKLLIYLVVSNHEVFVPFLGY